MRRTSVVSLFIALIASLTIGGGSIALAQDTTATDFTGHPLVGTWMLDTDLEDEENLPSLVIFAADGSYLEIDADGQGVGAWEPTGDTTATLTIWFSDEEGLGTIRASVEVSADGQTVAATYTLEIFDPVTGEGSGQIGPAAAEGTRIAVEAPGTPVMSFEEFFGQFEFEEGSGATPEATP